MEKELRKQRHLLVEAGAGVILFAVWSVAKVNLYLGLSALPIDEFHQVAEEGGLNETFFLIFLVVLVAGVLLFQLITHLYIGLSATAEGKGKSKGWFYLVATALTLLSTIQMDWQTFVVNQIQAGETLSANMITGICMELASIYVLLQLLISGIRVKWLKKKMKA